jgi:hypothetical protein
MKPFDVFSWQPPGWAIRRQRRRREIVVEHYKIEIQAPSGAASSVHVKHVHANGFTNMSLLTELEFLWDGYSTEMSFRVVKYNCHNPG